jgi:hypothetical protein
MAITKSFKKAVDDGNVKDIRIMLKESLLVDPTFTDFNEKISYVKNIDEVYVYHDGRELNSDESTWDDNYMDKLMSQLSTNFSKERVEHLKKVIRKLRPIAARPQSRTTTSYSGSSQRQSPHSNSTKQQAPRSQTNYQQQKHSDQRDGTYRRTKIAGGVVAGTVVGGTVAAIAKVTVIGGIAIGAVAGGVIATIITNGEK